MADYRGKISELDNKIIDAQDNHEKLTLLTEAIELNRAYSHALRRPVVAKFVWGTLILPLGVIALFPQAIIRIVKATVASKRADEYEKMRDEIRAESKAE